MPEKKFDARVIIYNTGDNADVAYTLISGKVELLDVIDGMEIRAGVIEPGGVFGDLAVFDPQYPIRQRTARSLEPCVTEMMTPEEFQKHFAECPKIIMPILKLACDKMKATRIKNKMVVVDAVLETDISKVTIAPASEEMKAKFKPIEVAVGRLPFRIGGYPESGEVSRRDQLHLAIPAQENPLRVSRSHCEIGVENKSVVVVDLGSRFCTSVNGTIIGRGRGTYSIPLKKGSNDITLGAADGPYKLTVTCK